MAEILFYFVLGAFIGSYLNVVALRYGLKSSTVGRSECFSCGKTLHWYELIPVFSYIFLRGRCSECKSRISPQYVLMELITGALFAGLVASGYGGFSLALGLISVSLLIAIGAYDIKHKIIPDGLVYTFIALSFAQLFIEHATLAFRIPSAAELFAGPVLFLLFFCLWYFSKGTWMGLGDGKLALGIGWYFGLSGGLSAIVLAFWVGAIVSVLLLILQKVFGSFHFFNQRITFKSEVPFAPFIILGFLAVLYVEFNLLAFIL